MDEEVEEEQNGEAAEGNTQIAHVQNELGEEKKASEVLFENDEQAAGEK
jgi:hypothetical protein